MNKVTVTHDTSGEKLEVPIEFVFIPAPSGFRYRLTDEPHNVGDVKPFYLAKYLHHKIDRFPSVNVDQNQAIKKANLVGGRLPSTYEWEWAAYGGEDWEYAGCTDVNKVAWTEDNCEVMQKVGLLRPNGYGLYDMSGLVSEWTSTAIDAEGIIKNDGSYRVYRGGSWYDGARVARVARRFRCMPSDRDDYLGFRIVMDVDEMIKSIQSGRAEVIR